MSSYWLRRTSSSVDWMVTQMSSSAWRSSHSSTKHKRLKEVLSCFCLRLESGVLELTWLRLTRSSSLIQTGTQWSTSRRQKELWGLVRQEMSQSFDSSQRKQLKRRSITGRSLRSLWLIASSLTQLDGSYSRRRTSTTCLLFHRIQTNTCFSLKSQIKTASRRALQRLSLMIVMTSYLRRSHRRGMLSLSKQVM